MSRPGEQIDEEMFSQDCRISGLEERLTSLEKAVIALSELVKAMQQGQPILKEPQ